MGRLSKTVEEREAEQHEREMRHVPDSDLGLDDVTVETTVSKRDKGELQFGKIALGALGTFLLTQVLGRWALQVIAGVSFIAFVVFGILWLISLFRD